MTSETVRDPLKDDLLTPQNSVLIIDYQPIQVASIGSMITVCWFTTLLP